MKNKKLEKIRKRLDILDNSFLNILKKRTKLVDQVLEIKKYKKDIIDRKRIKIILKNIKIKSRKKKTRYKDQSSYLEVNDTSIYRL